MYQLYKYDFFDVDTQEIESGQEEKSSFLIAQNPPINYSLYCDVQKLHDTVNNTQYDFKLHRDVAKEYLTNLGGGNLETGFNLLPDIDSKICAIDFKLGSQVQALTTLESTGLTSDESMTCYRKKIEKYNELMTYDRQIRFDHAVTMILTSIDEMSAFFILKEPFFPILKQDYIVFGVAGTNDGDLIEGLLNFVESTGSYLTTGLKTRSLNMLVTSEYATQIEMSEAVAKYLRFNNSYD